MAIDLLNETEATLLTGTDVDSREAAVAAGRWFVDRGTTWGWGGSSM